MSDRHVHPPYSLRLDPAVRKKLDEAAKRNKRSLSMEITSRLEETLYQDEYMAEMQAGDYREVMNMLPSVLADNDRMTENGEQTFSTAVGIISSLLDDKLTVLLKLLEREETIGRPHEQRLTAHEILEHLAKSRTKGEEVTLEKRGDTPSPTAKRPLRKQSRPLGMDQASWEAKRRKELTVLDTGVTLDTEMEIPTTVKPERRIRRSKEDK